MPIVTTAKYETLTHESDKMVLPEIRFTFDPIDGRKYKTYVVADEPKRKSINLRHQFQAGPYTRFFIWKPWSWMLVRPNEQGVILLSALFFSHEELKSVDQPGLLAAPLPNIDYGIDKGLGVCLWQSGRRFGPTPEEAAVNVHRYFWESDFNTGVRCWTEGRPKEIRPKKTGWRGSMRLWQIRTLKNQPVTFLPINDDQGKEVKTLTDAFKWLSRVPDGLYS